VRFSKIVPRGFEPTSLTGITTQVEVVDVATPMTYVRYTGNWQGSLMGWLDTPQNIGKMMSRTLPGLGSFYMAGQWVYVGAGSPERRCQAAI